MNTRIIGQWEVNLFNTNSLMVIPKHKPIKDEEEDDDKDRIEDEDIEDDVDDDSTDGYEVDSGGDYD